MKTLAKRVLMRTVVSSPVAARVFPFKQPPVLLLSYPRSGSSWVGSILGRSPDLAYLREPINQPFIGRTNHRTVWDPNADPQARALYKDLAARAFAGMPDTEDPNVVRNLRDFLFLHQRRRRRLLVKEVNPLAIELFLRDRDLQVIPLLRHPGAVAESYVRMGWHSGGLSEFGRLYGARMARVLDAVGSPATPPILYEDLAAEPHDRFLALFERMGVRPPEDYTPLIRRLCQAEEDPNSPYDIRRTSALEIDKWRDGLSAEAIQELRAGYFDSPLQQYRAPEDWP
jgi:hypothetical protein